MKTIKTRRFSFILAAIFTVMIIGYFAISFGLRGKLADKQNEYSSLEAECESVSADNENMKFLLDNADEIELNEHFARERGYVYPDETVYYDVTPGN